MKINKKVGLKRKKKCNFNYICIWDDNDISFHLEQSFLPFKLDESLLAHYKAGVH